MRWMFLRTAVLLIWCSDVGGDAGTVGDSKKIFMKRNEVRKRMKTDSAGFAEISHNETAQNIFVAQRDTTNAARPIIHLCALFALRFEAPYLLPWIAHHALYGVDHFHLYMDDVSSSWSEDFLEKHADLLRLLKNSNSVSLYSVKEHQIVGQEGQVEHCVINTVNLADWVGMWDIDESLASQTHGGGGTSLKHNILKHVLHKLPASALGVTLPRNVMGTRANHEHDHKVPYYYQLPFHEDILEYEQYTTRFKTDSKGKNLWRTGALVFPEPIGSHSLMSPDVLKDTVVAPDGTTLSRGSFRIPRNEKPCGNCNTPTLVTFWTMYNGLQQQTTVLKETTIVAGSMHAAMLARWNTGIEAAKIGNGIFRSNSLHAVAYPDDKCKSRTKRGSRQCRRDKNCKWSKVDNTCEEQGLTFLPDPLPDWVGILALNHYQKRSRGVCKWKAHVVKQKGSIFVNQHNDRSLNRVANMERCRPSATAPHVQDLTLATEAPLIWAKLTEMFGPEAKGYQLDEQHKYRDMVAEFMKAHPEHVEGSTLADTVMPGTADHRSQWDA